MQKSAVIRIVLWALVALLLVGVMIWGIENGFDGAFGLFRGRTGRYANSERYSVGGGSVSIEGIDAVEIHWTAGTVHAEVYDGDEITFEETGLRSSDEALRMRYLVEGGRLIIRYDAGSSWFSLSGEKTLNIKIPQQMELESFSIDTASANIDAAGIGAQSIGIEAVSGQVSVLDATCNKMDIEMVSGSLIGTNITANVLNTENVSGKTTVSGKISSADMESVSGTITLDASEGLKSADLASVSGSLTVVLWEDQGFSASYSSVSGRFHSDFAVVFQNNFATYKDGGAMIKLETVSGSMNIKMPQ